MKIFKYIVATAILSVSVLGTNLVQAQAGDVFEGQGYRVVIDEVSDAGLTYEGCNDKNQCLELNRGQRWTRSGKEGITWRNKEYRYDVSWLPTNPDEVTLEVFRGNKQILKRNLVKTSSN
jgi:hypothetical protein